MKEIKQIKQIKDNDKDKLEKLKKIASIIEYNFIENTMDAYYIRLEKYKKYDFDFLCLC
jgi:hypothetical protein